MTRTERLAHLIAGAVIALAVAFMPCAVMTVHAAHATACAGESK